MKFRPYQLLGALVFCMYFTSCKEIIEPSLTDHTINALAPGAGYQSKTYAINFWWDSMNDARSYRVQIVTPGFGQIGAMIADTLVKTNKVTLNLEPGEYEWRVRAENNNSASNFSQVLQFSVAASSIKGQSVLLTSPAQNFITNEANTLLKWNTLYGATNYRLQIDTNNFADTLKLIYNQKNSLQEFVFNAPVDQRYQWRVRAENDTAMARWSETRVFSVDRTAPAQVSATLPADNAVVTLPINLQWTALSGISRYKLYIYKEDGVTLYNSNYPMSLSATTYTFNLGTTQEKIYWKVSAVDAAGNEGQPSLSRSFTIR